MSGGARDAPEGGFDLGALRPPREPAAAPFWEAAARGALCLPRCPATGRLFFPPAARSPFAPRRTPGWSVVSGRARIWSFAVPHPPLLPPFDALAPYVVVLAALEEDARVRLVGALEPAGGGSLRDVDPAAVAIGAPVRAAFAPAGDGLYLLRWRLAD